MSEKASTREGRRERDLLTDARFQPLPHDDVSRFAIAFLDRLFLFWKKGRCARLGRVGQ